MTYGPDDLREDFGGHVGPLRPHAPNKSSYLRAKGNLTYLEFIRLVEVLWRDSHPDIPFSATAGDQQTTYPRIIYALQMRKTHPSEPKMRYREQIGTSPGDEGIIISGQRYQNVINFSAVAERDPRLVEELVEAFEDFMMEYTPVFKELGVSEFIYGRRLPDDEEMRPGEGIVKRTVSYLVTTEKVVRCSVARLNEVLVRARLVLAEEQATFSAVETGAFTFLGASFDEGDRVVLFPRPTFTFPILRDANDALVPANQALYVHSRVSEAGGIEYYLGTTLTAEDAIQVLESGEGYIAVASPEAYSASVATELAEN